VRVAPNRKMAADGWFSPWGGGDDDDGGQKCVGEGRSGSIAGVDERQLAWPCAEENEGEKRRGERDDIGRLFEAEAARQGRGSGSVPRGGRERKMNRAPGRGVGQRTWEGRRG
jgi:hypothetical protein